MESFIGGKLLDVAGSKLTDVITDVLKKTWYFKSLLTEIKETMKKLNEKRDLRKEESNKFIDLIKEAEELIWECEQIKSVNLWKRYRHVKKLDELNKSLHEFVKSDNQFSKKMSVFERGSSSGWSSGVPLPDGDVIGFEDRVNDLKRMVLKESIVVVSAAGGCGKSTLVKMLCHDPEIQDKKMEHNLTPLCDIDPMLDDIKVVARCISKWKPHTLGKPNDVWSLDFVLQDAQGNRVHGTCKKDHINKFQLALDEGSCYRIGNFGVGENGGNYPLLSHRYKLNLYKNSSVTRLPSFDSNVCGFKFEPFSNLYVRQFTEAESVDVIGTIMSISDLIPFTKYGKEKKRRNLIIEDVEGIQLQCCFFDSWATKFDNLHAQREKVGHVVMILQLAKVSYFGDKPSVTNAMWGSKLYLNDDIPEIKSFRQMYESQDGHDPSKHSISIFSSAKKEVTMQDFFKGGVKKMVGSIRDTDDEYNCIVYAKIHKIHREHGWAYLACKRCGCKAIEKEKKHTSSSSSNFKKQQTWHCKKHKEITNVGMKMKVIVRVIDDTGSASLVMFDDMIAKLCGVDCYGLIKEYGPEVDDYFPAELNTLVGKKLLFRFEYTDFNVTHNNHVYQIKLISDEEDAITFFKKDFIVEDVGDDVQTPIMSAVGSNKFKTVDNIPFNIEETPKSVKGDQSSAGDSGIQASVGEPSSSGSGKRSFIDLDDVEEEDENKKTKLVEVKVEPED